MTERQPQCDRCHADDLSRRHPISYAIDGTNNFWMSPTLANGLKYEWVTVTIDLRQVSSLASFLSPSLSLLSFSLFLRPSKLRPDLALLTMKTLETRERTHSRIH